MNEEELRAEVTRLTNENKSLTDKYNILNEQIKTKDDEINSLNSTVSDLKQKNYDLFIQLPNNINADKESNIPTQSENTISTADVISQLLGGN